MKKILYIGLSILLTLATSCSDFLEEDNKGGVNNDDFYSTASGYTTLVTASYSSLRDVYGAQDPILQLAGTDIYMEGKDNAGPLYRYNALFANNDDITEFYTNCYTAMQTINTGIYYNNSPSDLSNEKKTQYLGELRFLRAFYHFILIEQFGGVVIDSVYTNSAITNIPRSTLADSYNFVINEMKAALNEVSESTEAGRVNKDVVNHYLAKVYLTRAWDLDSQDDFNTAISYANAVISSKGDISISYEDVWSPDNENNGEFIFSIQYDLKSVADVKEGGNTQSSLFGVYGGTGGLGVKRYKDAYVPAQYLHASFQDNDSRYQYNFMWAQHEVYFDYYEDQESKIATYYPVIRNASQEELTAADTAACIEAIGGEANKADVFRIFPIWAANTDYAREKYNKVSWLGATDKRLPTVKKFDCPDNAENCTLSYSASVRDIVLARLAETYFLKAEAYIGLNKIDEAREIVQKVIDRPDNKISDSGVDITNAMDGVSSQQDALEAYLLETAKEMLGEYNGRWPLLRRTNMLQYMVEKYNDDLDRNNITFDEKYILRPIPEDAITANDGLTKEDQNPGY